MSRQTILPVALAMMAALAPAATKADSLGAPPAVVSVREGWRGPDGQHMAALEVTLAQGWKTYWRAPGEAGIPPEIDWAGSENLGAVEFHWPVPDVFESNGMTTLGYSDRLVLPMEITPVDPGGDVTLSARILIGVCHEVCVPLEADLVATLSQVEDTPDRTIQTALGQRPDTSAEAGLVSARCAIAPIADGLRVTARLDLPQIGSGEFAVFEAADRTIWVSEAVARRSEGMLTATADLVPPSSAPFLLDLDDLRITVLASGRAVDIEGCDPAR